MNPIADLIAAELPRHVDTILREDGWDTGGLRCSCGEWSALPDGPERLRPRAAWHAHVAAAIQRAITTAEAVDTLSAINQRLIVPRIGSSYMREMDRDIVTLRSAAAMLTLILAGGR